MNKTRPASGGKHRRADGGWGWPVIPLFTVGTGAWIARCIAPPDWGNDLISGDRWVADIKRGRFPIEDKGEDGFAGIASHRAISDEQSRPSRHGGQLLGMVRRPVSARLLRTTRQRRWRGPQPIGRCREKTRPSRWLVPLRDPYRTPYTGDARRRRSQHGKQSHRISLRHVRCATNASRQRTKPKLKMKNQK
jgi:hypothetical protein